MPQQQPSEGHLYQQARERASQTYFIEIEGETSEHKTEIKGCETLREVKGCEAEAACVGKGPAGCQQPGAGGCLGCAEFQCLLPLTRAFPQLSRRNPAPPPKLGAADLQGNVAPPFPLHPLLPSLLVWNLHHPNKLCSSLPSCSSPQTERQCWVQGTLGSTAPSAPPDC